MRRAKYLLYALALMCILPLQGQTKSEFREMFVSAEGDILFEDYAEALPKYLNLLQFYPENYNYYFRIGQCYLNTPGEKDKSISFLETAARNINPEYRRGKFRETGAPYDALYFLANAYRIGNDLDKAVETYTLFMQNVDPEVYDTNLVRFQIEECYNAREMMKKPVYVVEKNLGDRINQRFSEFNPVISSDEQSMLFTRELQFYDAVFWSTKVNGQWSNPVNLTPELGIDQDYYTSSLTGDGKTLLLYRIDRFDGNIYQSRLSGDKWSDVEKLNSNINTKYWESHATLTQDGRRLFFTSNRKESLGGLDIFISERDSTGDWGPAKNIGPVINTEYDEETPFLANNDRTLFFSSRGHHNIGGYDIFRSDLDEKGEWGAPVNIGYPVNTTDDDLFFMPVGKGNRGYLSRFTTSGQGKMDILTYDIYSDLNPRNFFITGRAAISNLLSDYLQTIEVTAINNADTKRVISAITNPVTGLYSFWLPQGSYRFTFTSDGALTMSQTYEMPVTHKSDTVNIDPVTLYNTDVTAYLKLSGDSVVTVTSADPVPIGLMVEAMSTLDITVLMPDSNLIAEQHRINDTTFTYSFVPSRGDSRITFNLTDRFGNTASAAVLVTRTGPARAQKPLYKELPVRPPAAAAVETTVADEDTVKAVTEAVAPAIAGDEVIPETARGEGCSCLWWLLLLVPVIIFLILRRRRKKKKEETDKA
jgi:tetratricopeptide (TPR) repeat protein